MKHKAPNRFNWKPRYAKYTLDGMLLMLDDIDRSPGAEPGRQNALAESERFIRGAFSGYSGHDSAKQSYGFIFAVPTRIQRSSDNYFSEAAHFLPIVSYLDKVERQLLISGLPPCVIDTYDRDPSVRGAIMFVPLFIDMLWDIKPRLLLARAVKKVIDDTSRFAAYNLHASIVGLGATLPRLTNYGTKLRKHGVVTTTGHGGTVYLMVETLRQVIATDCVKNTHSVGCIGAAGAIGESTMRKVLHDYPDVNVSVYDTRTKKLQLVVSELNTQYGRERVTIAASNDEVLEKSGITFSAITSRVHIGEHVDLSDKIIIDDSQPASFDTAEVEYRGGRLIWVVGHDSSKTGLLTRNSDYRFGEEGLLYRGDVWGCEAEVASLYALNRLDLALSDSVSPVSAQNIGEVMSDLGVTVAAYQQHGKPVIIDTTGRAQHD